MLSLEPSWMPMIWHTRGAQVGGHFLPVRFMEAVLTQEKKQKYLHSDEINSYFMGEHIQYDVKNCRMIIALVMYHGKWSNFFWDFHTQLVTVLDPTRMGKSSEEV